MTELLSVEQLKPCPFCGGTSAGTETLAAGIVWSGVECLDCGAKIEEMSEEEAITAWNTRAALPPTQGVEEAGWQPIETAPKDRAILLYARETGERAICTYMTAIEDGEEAWIMARGDLDTGVMVSFAFRRPTNWMEQPAPPLASIGEEVA